MSEAVTTIATFLRRAVEEAYQKGESVVICSDALLLEIAAHIECIENERSCCGNIFKNCDKCKYARKGATHED